MHNAGRQLVSLVIVCLVAAAGTSFVGETARAHEMPVDVVVQAWLKPQDDRLVLLVRVPLEAMRDISFPQIGPGYLDIAAADSSLHDAAQIWIANGIDLYEGDERLDGKRVAAVRVSLPSDQSFRDFDRALAHITGPPLPIDTRIVWNQALLDVLIETPIADAGSDFSIDTELARLGMRTVTVLRYVTADGAERPFEFSGNPGLVRLDPSWLQAFGRFVLLGVEHILQGIDHLLFILCLIIPFRRLRPLVVLVTSFTVAHSITLMAAASGMVPTALWFPPLIETLIAASIVYMAIENIVGTRWQRRWVIAFAFGLVHGFGFSFALSETLQFAGSHLVTSLLAFNVGVEIGQLLVVLVAVPVLNLVLRSHGAEKVGTIILSALLAHSGWHWMSDRFSDLAQYDLRLPAQDLVLLAVVARWLAVVIVIVTIGWLTFRSYRRFLHGR